MEWDEDAYRARLRADMVAATRTVFAARFAPSSIASSSPPEVVATASSDGSVCLYSISSCVGSSQYSHNSHFEAHNGALDIDPQSKQSMNVSNGKSTMEAEPILSLPKHNGPAYDLQFYESGDQSVLLSSGDDGRIQGWHWEYLKNCISCEGGEVKLKEPDFVMVNPQNKGPRGALAAMPEINAIACNSQDKCVFSAAGDGLAYCWDIETQKIRRVFAGHSDYLHCVCARPSENQVITGSEDGTIRVWDCRSSDIVAILDPWKARRILKLPKERSPWVSCIALDSNEKWMVCGSGGHCVTLWCLSSLDAATRIATLSAPQAIAITKDQIMMVGAQPRLSSFKYGGDMVSQVSIAPLSAFSVSVHPSGITVVGGYGGLVDIISEFGSHMCTFQCK